MSEPLIIKKYANRRLYNTETSSYITLADLAGIIREGRNVEVVDAKSGDDLTRATLAQIILEEDAKGAALLPTSFLKAIIGFYDNSMQTVLPHYLDMVMEAFKKNQAAIQKQTNETLGSFSPFAQQVENMQEFQRKQLEQMQQMMGLFNPFLRTPDSTTPDPRDEKIAELEAELEKLRKEKR